MERRDRSRGINEAVDDDLSPSAADAVSVIDERLAEADIEPLVGRTWADVEVSLRRRIP